MGVKVLVCGGRDYRNWQAVFSVLDAFCEHEQPIDAVIHGAATGADSAAGGWAKERFVPEWRFPANWERWGKSAGFLRNEIMLQVGKPDIVFAFPGGNGTSHMVHKAKEAGVPVRCVGWQPKPWRSK